MRPAPRNRANSQWDARRVLGVGAAAAALALVVALAPLAAAKVNSATGQTAPGQSANASAGIGHVFVINLENKGYDKVWNNPAAAPYLAGTLRDKGVLLSQYYAVASASLPNYLAQISGQAPNERTITDCPTFRSWTGNGTMPPGQASGSGCVYPNQVATIADQLTTAGKTWKGYMEDMGAACRHPELDKPDDSKKARAGDQYATRHNPFVYFSHLVNSPACQTNVVDYSRLRSDLASVGTTPNFSYITPNLCHDGHDNPCVDGSTGGLPAVDAWLRNEVPAILSSPAFKEDGLLVITFDESDERDAAGHVTQTAPASPGATAELPGGTGGGLVGALALSPRIAPGTTSETAYNHYGLLGSIEDIFSLPYLGYAGAFGQSRFGFDVYNAGR